MANSWFQFKQFTIHQDKCAMKVTTDACLFGGWVAREVGSRESGVGSQESGVDSRNPVATGSVKVLEIGAGTGLLSLMIAQKVGADIEAIEIDREAFEQAKENTAASPWAEHIVLLHGDARKFEARHLYDMIISNPPFYENEWRSDSPKKNIALHSDDLSLNEVFTIIKKNLRPGGVFFLLLPFKRQEKIKELMTEHKLGIEKIIFVRQSVKHDYFRMMIKGVSVPAEVMETIIDEMAIKDENNEYTQEFIQLLKDYYLYL